MRERELPHSCTELAFSSLTPISVISSCGCPREYSIAYATKKDAALRFLAYRVLSAAKANSWADAHRRSFSALLFFVFAEDSAKLSLRGRPPDDDTVVEADVSQ